MSNILLRVKTKNGQQVINNLTLNSTIKDLKQALSLLSSIPEAKLQVLTGFPPKTLDISQDDSSLVNSGISTGDTLILQESTNNTSIAPSSSTDKADERLSAATEPSSNLNNTLTEETINELSGILMKHIVAADNSCLFTSINFVLSGKVDESGEAAKYLRKLVAETILNESHNYDEAILGKPLEQYCSWIQNDTSWGGAIELAILSNFYGIEIAVVDTVNAIINRFGEDQNYPLRVFLMFDGIHYDPLFLEPFDGGKIQTIFETSDERMLQEAKLLAHEAKSSRQFTDVNKFTLKCMICNVLLKGQVEAQTHAKSTGHANFGEV